MRPASTAWRTLCSDSPQARTIVVGWPTGASVGPVPVAARWSSLPPTAAILCPRRSLSSQNSIALVTNGLGAALTFCGPVATSIESTLE